MALIEMLLFMLVALGLTKPVQLTNCRIEVTDQFSYIIDCTNVKLNEVNAIWLWQNCPFDYRVEVRYLYLHDESMRLSLSNQLDLTSFTFGRRFQLRLLGFNSIQANYTVQSLLHYPSYYGFASGVLVSTWLEYFDLRLEQGNQALSGCELSTLSEAGALQPKFIDSVYFHKSVRYHQQTCSVLFLTSRVTRYHLDGLIDSFLLRNVISFVDLMDRNRTATTGLKHRFAHFELGLVYNAPLSSRIFTAQLFNSTWPIDEIVIDGVLGRVEQALFRFVRCSRYVLKVRNMRQFLHNNLKWPVSISMDDSSVQLLLSQDSPGQDDAGYVMGLVSFSLYNYDQSDFCLFRHYPVNSSVFVFIIQKKAPNLTCPLGYLLQQAIMNRSRAEHVPGVRESGLWQELKDLDAIAGAEKLLAECDFDLKLSLCDQVASWSGELESQFNIYELVLSVESLKLVFAICLHPISCILGLVVNTLSAVTIKRTTSGRQANQTSQSSDKQKKLFEYFFYNAVCSGAFCALNAPLLLAECIQYSGGRYCSPLIASFAMRLYFLVGVVFLGNICKLGANLTQCSFTLYRMLINTNGDRAAKKWSSRLLRAKPIYVLLAIGLFSVLLSVSQLFYNDRISIKTLENLPGFDMFIYDLNSDWYSETNKLLIALNVLNLLLNDVFSTLFNLVFDLKLLRFVQAAAKKQAQLSSSGSKEKEDVEKRLTKMIIVNGIFSLGLKTPQMLMSSVKTAEFAINTWYKYEKTKRSSWCMFAKSFFDSLCANLITVTDTVAVWALLINFFLFLNFNAAFRSQLVYLFNRRLELAV
nr:G protein-coupled receptor [Proales similis]